MRLLASYAFEAPLVRGPSGVVPGEVERRVEAWLASKGEPTADGRGIRFKDGRLTEVVRTNVESAVGRVFEAALTEPRPDGDGRFRTSVAVAETEEAVAVSVGLAAASQYAAQGVQLGPYAASQRIGG